MATATRAPNASVSHDGLMRGLSITYLLVAAIYVPGVWWLLKMQRDMWASFPTDLSAKAGMGSQHPLAEMNGVFTVIILMTIAFGTLLVVLSLLLTLRRGYAICFALAILLTVLFPLGTVLGGLTIYALLRPDIQAQFNRAAA